MPRLINRNKQVPGGMKFYDANLRWTSPAWASFQTICDGLRTARLANPGITAAKGLATDPNAIANEVDSFIAANCAALGQNDFIQGGPGGAAPVPFTPAPRPRPSPFQQAKNLAAGSKTIVEWIASKEAAVPAELSSKRAATCAQCPLNLPPNWAEHFTVSAANAIKSELERKRGWNLTTPFDDVLGICGGCSCVNSLSVHCDLNIKLKNMPKEAHDALHSSCWVLAEEKALTSATP